MLFSYFRIGSHPPNLLSLGKYQPPSWFCLGSSPPPIIPVPSLVQGHLGCTSALDSRPAASASVWTRAQPGGSRTPLREALLSNTALCKASSSLPPTSTGWEEGFSFLVFSLVFWFSFCGSALPCFVYRHQSWNQLCLFVDLSFPWNLRIFLGHSVFLIIKKVVHMAAKERLGSKKPQTHRGPSVALPLAQMTGNNS